MLEEVSLLQPAEIKQKLIPKLKQLIENSDGKLKGYYIWPHHLEGGMDRIYPQGRRYPKRLRKYQPKPDDKVIKLHGVEIGYLIPTVPFLNCSTWKGIGL